MWRSSRIPVVGVGVVVVCLGLFGWVQLELQESAQRSQEDVAVAQSVEGIIRTIDGLEWRAIAGEDVEEVDAKFRAQVSRLEGLLASDSAAEMSVAADRYVAAISDMLVALERGDRAEAQEIDEARVDPGFEQVIDHATLVVDEKSEAASSTYRQVQSLTLVVVALLGTVIVGGLSIIDRTRERSRSAEVRASTGERFRSMVQGSRDVFTSVGDGEEITLLSGSWGFLERFVRDGGSVRPHDLLPVNDIAKWRRADAHVTADGGRQELELTLEARDGLVVHVELHGSLLSPRAPDRVWVWRDVTERKALELQLRHDAFHDPLTGLANRTLLRDRLQHALAVASRGNRPVSVLFMDLDNFKAINDSLGHSYGDELICAIARRIEACARPSDTVARLGGDEFAVLVHDGDLDQARVLGERILAIVANEIELAGKTVHPSVSVGIAGGPVIFDVEQLLRNADLAMYDAKQSGKGRVAVFRDQLQDAATDLFRLQGGLRTAIDNGELRLHYQPTVRLADGCVDGVEALLRWQHPTRGLLPPDQFIPLAESNGLIVPLGRWALREACRQAVILGDAGHPSLRMAVNVSPAQLRGDGIVELVREVLDSSGLPAARLVLEITEGALLDAPNAIGQLHDLHDLGVVLAVDDFGTGYSSIAYLQQLPISILKIDRSFVSGTTRGPDERPAFLRAIVELAGTLGMQSVAEGIESQDQLDELRALGCDLGQGFWWSHPEDPATIGETIRRLDRHRGAREEPVHQAD